MWYKINGKKHHIIFVGPTDAGSWQFSLARRQTCRRMEGRGDEEKSLKILTTQIPDSLHSVKVDITIKSLIKGSQRLDNSRFHVGWSIVSRLSGCWAVWGVKRAPGSIVILPGGGWEEKSAWRLTHLINNRDRQQAHLDLYCPSLMLSKYSIYLHAQRLFRHTYTHTHTNLM